MEIIQEHFVNRYRNDERVNSMSAIYSNQNNCPAIDGFDVLILVITSDHHDAQGFISHYIKDQCRIQERWISAAYLEDWIAHGENRDIIQWIFCGEILIDRTSYLETLRHRLLEFDQGMRERKLLREFSLFNHEYLRGKDYLQHGHVLDAYTAILTAVHHWARIAIIEAGKHPELTVWQQVHQINPGIYKLYEELTLSNETLEQRVQLLVLACEFTASSKMKDCCALLIRVLGSRQQSWSVMELNGHSQLVDLPMELLSSVLKKLVKKSLVDEIVVSRDTECSVLELQYSLNRE